jgi:hypothetical protein
MRRLFGLGLTLVVVCGFSGCGGGGPEGQLKEMISTMNQLADSLESIKDDASADAAIPKIESAAEKMGDLAKKMKDQKLSKEEDKRLQDKYEKELQAATKRMQAAALKAIQKAPGKAQKIGAAMQKAGK